MEDMVLVDASLRVVDDKVARLRHQAEHCRRLALGICDDRMISALEAMALEYELQADQVEGGTSGDLGRRIRDKRR